MKLSDLARQIQAYCNHHALSQFGLIGHSLGGKVAMATAMQCPHQVDLLVIMDMSPTSQLSPQRQQEHRQILAALAQVAEAQVTNRQQAMTIMKPFIPSEMIRQFLSKSLYRTNDGYLSWKIDYQQLQHSQSDSQSDNQSDSQWTWLGASFELNANNRFDRPCCFIYGTQSDYVTPSDHAVIFEHFQKRI